MKILFSIPSVCKADGGIAEVIPREAEELLRFGHDVRIVVGETADYSDAALRAEQAGVRICREPSTRRFGVFRVTREYYQDLVQLIDWADIVHINCLWMDSTWVTTWICRRKGKPYFLQTHGALNHAALKKSNFKKWLVGNLIERTNLNHADVVVATAENEKQGIIDFGIKAPIEIVPIGLDVQNYAPITISQVHDIKTLLYFSRVSPGKGLDMLAEAWKQLQPKYPDWHLVITGPDDRGYTKELQAYLTEIGLEYQEGTTTTSSTAITFTGPVYGEGKYAVLQSADAFVLPTRSENWSIAVAEAMASGLPVVCTKGAPWACINECGCGHWVDVSVEAIREGLEDVMSKTDEQRHEMGLRGRQWVEQNLGWTKIANDLVNCYERVILSSKNK